MSESETGAAAGSPRADRGPTGLIRAVGGTAVGGLLVLVASGRRWAGATISVPAGPRSLVVATGHAVEPALPALGIALLVLAVGIIAGRGRIRRLVGLVTALTALGTVAVAILGRGDVSSTLTGKEPGGLGIAVHAGANGWWIVALAGGLLALACGAATLAYGPRWAALGAKYEAPQADRAPIAASVDEWDALDRGEDPTT